MIQKKRVKGLPKYWIYSDGRVWSDYRNKFLHTRKDRYGYLRTGLMVGENKQEARTIHRLVAENFLRRKSEDTQVNHKDGNKLNNLVSNLEWCTVSHNISHGFKLGLHKSKKGVSSNLSKLSEMDVFIIRGLLKYTSKSHAKIGSIFGVSTCAIYKIKHNLTWRHI